MKINLLTAGPKARILSASLTVIAVLALIMLGNWQLRRLDYKNEFIKRMEHNIASPAIHIDSADLPVELYSKVTIPGKFLEQKDVLLYGRRSASAEKDGYYLLSPFKSDDGRIYLVSRGWVAQSRKASVKDSLISRHEEITAIAMPGEKKRFFMPENDAENGVWFTLDLDMAATIMGVDQADFYLMQIEAEDLPEGVKPLSATNLSKIRNDHLEYAITWYILAACLVGVYAVYYIKNTKKQ